MIEPLVCSPEHIGVLASYGHKKSIDPHCWHHNQINFLGPKIATALAEVITTARNEWTEWHIRHGSSSDDVSIDHKIRQAMNSDGDHNFDSDTDYTEACQLATLGYFNNPPSVTAIEIIKLARNFADQCHSPFFDLDYYVYPEENVTDHKKVRYAQLVINDIVMWALEDVPGYREAPDTWAGKTGW